MKSAETTQNSVTTPQLRQALLWLAMIFLTLAKTRDHYRAVMSLPRLSAPLGPADPDVWLYLTQTRQWLYGLTGAGDWRAAFFDHAVRNTNAPFGGITTPWTRPMEILLLAAYALTPHGLETEIRLLLAATWLSAALWLGGIALLAYAIRAQFNSLHAAGFAGLLMLVNPDTYDWFATGNIDHHGLLSLLWCGVIALLMQDALRQAGALILGGTLGLMIWISPESLLLAGIVYSLLGGEALLKPARAAAASLALARVAAGTALAAALGLAVEMPLAQISSAPACDTLSVMQLTLLLLAAAGAGAFAYVCRLKTGFGARFFTAALISAGVLLAMQALYPKFFAGPLADADPFILTNLIPRIDEMKPLLRGDARQLCRELLEPALAAALAAFALGRRYVRPARQRRLVILLLLLAVTAALTLWEVRWAYYLHPVSIVILGMTVAGLGAGTCAKAARRARALRRPLALLALLAVTAVIIFDARLAAYMPFFTVAALGMILTRLFLMPVRPAGAPLPPLLLPRQARPYLLLWLFYLFTSILLIRLPAESALPGPAADAALLSSTCVAQIRYVVQTGQLQPLFGPKNTILFVPEDAGEDVLFFTPYRIIASTFHREGAGLSDMYDISRAPSAAAARPLLRRRQVAALLYCPGFYGADSWLGAASQAAKRPAWLKPVGNLRLMNGPNGAPPPEAAPLLLKIAG